ncbi:MAG: hypothetical protein ACXW5U_10040 [Thermoanaerobaculia bacterium]
MKSSRPFLALIASIPLIHAAAATAAGIDMDDPRRALGREGDVRVDAQLVRDTVSPGAPIGVTYQIQNLSDSTVAIAAKVSDASYDEDTRTITLALGSEVPPDGNMPQMVVIPPGEKKLLQASATPKLQVAALRAAFAASPRYVQVKVAILRDIQPFVALIDEQDGRTKRRLSDELFEKWFECNDTIFLNSVPVQFVPSQASDVESAGGGRMRGGI